MIRSSLVALCIAAFGAFSASAATVNVTASEAVAKKLVGVSSGVELASGQTFIVSTDAGDLWSYGRRAQARVNADGRDDRQLTLGTDTFARGALVGRIGNGAFFLIGAQNTLEANATGILDLFIWDKRRMNNRGAILVNISFPAASQLPDGEEDLVAPVPLPAGAPLLLAGFGVLALLRRRKSA